MKFISLYFVIFVITYVTTYNDGKILDIVSPDIDDSEMANIYYEPKSRKPFPLSSIENMLMNKPVNGDEFKSNIGSNNVKWINIEKTNISFISRRIGYRSNGCTCQQLNCGCCLGINLNQFSFNREGCLNFTYVPSDLAIVMNMIMDGNSVFDYTFSARNPPPLCIPVIIPYVPLEVQNCAKLYDIYTSGLNLHMCFDFETRIEKATVLILHFDCMQMGNLGVSLTKPGEGFSTATTEQIDSDIYNQVIEIKNNPTV